MITGKEMKALLTGPAVTLWALKFSPNKMIAAGPSYKKPPDSKNSAAEMRGNKAKVTRQDPSLLIEADEKGNASLVPPTDNHATFVKISSNTEIVISYDFTGCSFAMVAGPAEVAVAHIFRGGDAKEIDANAKAQLENVKKAVSCTSEEKVAVFRTKGLKAPKGATGQSLVIGCLSDSCWTWYSIFVADNNRIVSATPITGKKWQAGSDV